MAVLKYHKPTNTDLREMARRRKWLIRKETGGDNPTRPWKVRRFSTQLDLWLCTGSFTTWPDAIAHAKRLAWNERNSYSGRRAA